MFPNRELGGPGSRRLLRYTANKALINKNIVLGLRDDPQEFEKFHRMNAHHFYVILRGCSSPYVYVVNGRTMHVLTDVQVFC